MVAMRELVAALLQIQRRYHGSEMTYLNRWPTKLTSPQWPEDE